MITAPHVLDGRDRPAPFGPWPCVGGGQIWTQTAFPCFSEFVVYLGDPGFVLVNNPMHSQGNIALQWRGPPWEIHFTSEQLQLYLHEHHYQYEGQCYDLMLERKS